MLCILTTSLLQAQYWKPLGEGCLTWGGVSIQTIFGDSILNRLLVGGTFTRMINTTDTVLCLGVGQWNGERWDSLATRINYWNGGGISQTHWFFRYKSDLYAVGNFGFYDTDGVWIEDFARFVPDEQRWEGLECLNPSFDGMDVLGWRDPQDTLYATGFKGSICGYPESCVFTYDGNAFAPWPPFDLIPPDPNNYIGFVFKFQAYTYMYGSFRNPLDSGWANFMRFGQGSWEVVPGWSELFGSLKDYVIQGDTLLYVAGGFHADGGAPGNLVASYDGTDWHDLNGGLVYQPAVNNGVVTDLLLWHDALYAAGVFTHAGGVSAPKLARWNGVQWCGFPGNFVGGPGLNEMTVWRDSLYVCGAFTTVDGQTANTIAQWIGGDATGECSEPVSVPPPPIMEEELRLQPSSVAGTWTLLGPGNGTVTVVDMQGREVLSSPVRAARAITIDLQERSSGIYAVQFTSEQGRHAASKILRP